MSTVRVALATLRRQRRGMLIWGISLGLLLVATAVGWAKAYPDVANRESLAQSLRSGFTTVEIIYGKPVRVEEIGGFLAWRGLGLYPVIAGLYAILTFTSTTRGAEESGIIEVVIAAARGRGPVLIAQLAACIGSLLAVCAFCAVGAAISWPLAGEGAGSITNALLAAVNLFAAALLFGALALLVAQFTRRRRTAVFVAGIALFAAHIWNNLGLIVPAFGEVHALSPLYFYARSTPLADGHVDVAALGLLFGMSIGLGGAAVILATRRDLFDAFVLIRPRTDGAGAKPAGPAARAILLRTPFARALRDSLGVTVGWAIGLSAFAALIASAAPGALDAIKKQAGSELFKRLQESGAVSEAGILSFILITFLPLMLGLFAVTLVSSWTSDEGTGRLDIDLATPIPRPFYYLQRLGAGMVATALAAVVTGTVLAVTATANGLDVRMARILLAFTTLLPVPATVLAFGFVVAAWRPRLATGIAGAAIAFSFFLDLLVPLFGWPDGIRYASVFHLYGQPILDGFRWAPTVALLAVLAGLTALGCWRFTERDLER